MKLGIIAASAAALACMSLAVPAPLEAAGGGKAKTSVHKAGGSGKAGAGNRAGGSGKAGAGNRAGATNKSSTQRRNVKTQGNTNRSGNRNTNVDKRGGNNVVAGNTVVVNKNVDTGYHHHGYDNDYYDRWDDDDDDFLEFVGKTAVVTAGVAVTAAVIGEIVEDEPDNCQQTVAYGQTYLYCNGVWYQPTMSGSNVNYVVVNDPN